MVNLWLIMVNNWNNNISGWCFGTFGLFSTIYGIIILPIDELIFFKIVKTTNQFSTPGPHRELQISVGTAGPKPRAPDLALAVEVLQCPCQRACQNKCPIECQNRMSDRMPE